MTMQNAKYVIMVIGVFLLVPASAVSIQALTNLNGTITVNEELYDNSTALYDLLFSDVDVFDEIKLQIIKNSLHSESILLPVPENQQVLGKEALLNDIKVNTNP